MQLSTTHLRRAATTRHPTGQAAFRARFIPVALLLVTCVSWAGFCRPVRAWSGQVHSKSAAGTRVTIDTRWVDAPGYRPVRVTVTPITATTVDKTFTVEFLLSRRYWGAEQHDLRVARDIELPAGSGPVQATVSLPYVAGCDSYKINVLEDGELQQGLCVDWNQFSNLQTDWGECLPAILVVGDNPAATNQLGALLPLQDFVNSQTLGRYNQGYYPPNSPPVASGTRQVMPTAITRPIADLPQRWIDYSTLDVVCLSLGQLEEVVGKNPPARKALLQWTSAGGNLWVYGVGQDWQRLGKLEDLLGLPPRDADAGDPVTRGWTLPDKTVYLRAVQGGLTQAPLTEDRYTMEFPAGGGDSPAEYTLPDSRDPRKPVGKAPAKPHFLLREYGLGLVAALAPDDALPGRADRWRGVLNAVGPDRWLWYRRHGLSMVRPNRDYWNFLIPGVGMVPVTEFCVMITLFVLGIGPLNYWLLRRWKRLHLLVVTIPLGAATVTLALFGYALISDGLATRVRARSVTQLDQGRGQAACWSRLSYYAGLAPRGGLTFPDDVVVLPLEYLPMRDYRDGPLRRELIWNESQEKEKEEEQWLASGWLASRTPMQLLTVRSRPSRLGLDLIRPADAAGKLAADGLQVKNRLGTRIKQLVVCSDDRKYYTAGGVGTGQTVALKPFTPQDRRELLQIWRENEPRPPEGMQAGGYGYGGILGMRYYGGYYNGNPAIAPSTQQSNRLEASLDVLREISGGDLSQLAPGSYVAIVERSPEVVLGVASAREEASYHVILGKW